MEAPGKRKKHAKARVRRSDKRNEIFVRMENVPSQYLYDAKGKLTGELFVYSFDPEERTDELFEDAGILAGGDGITGYVPAGVVPENTFTVICQGRVCGPPAPPKPPEPVKLPPLKDEPRTAKDRKLSRLVGGTLRGNPRDPRWGEIRRRLWDRISDPEVIDGVKVPIFRKLKRKFRNCDLRTCLVTFYAIGRPFWRRFFYARRDASVGAKGLFGFTGSIGSVLGELVFSEYQAYGAKVHILCGDGWCTVDLGQIGEILLREVAFKDYMVRYIKTSFNSTGKEDLGTFKGGFRIYDRIPRTPAGVAAKYRPGETSVYNSL